MLIILKKKRECNVRAQKIVEELLDPVAPEKLDDFLANVSCQLSFLCFEQDTYDKSIKNSLSVALFSLSTSASHTTRTLSKNGPLRSCAAIHCVTYGSAMRPSNSTKYPWYTIKCTTSRIARVSVATNATSVRCI